MKLNFDTRGNLEPYKVIEISMDVFRNTFVNGFGEDSIRRELFENYNKYLKDLTQFLSKDFFQLVDGSYITNKVKPNDIDFVSVIDYRDYEAHQMILENEFASSVARKKYQVDAYIMASYPENHKKHVFTKSDLLYWRNLFGKTRVNRNKKQFEKGIIQLNFKNNG